MRQYKLYSNPSSAFPPFTLLLNDEAYGSPAHPRNIGVWDDLAATFQQRSSQRLVPLFEDGSAAKASEAGGPTSESKNPAKAFQAMGKSADSAKDIETSVSQQAPIKTPADMNLYSKTEKGDGAKVGA
eukprot:scaffold239684_cov26-Prasinocladus_malaysianus.AAC.1